MILTVLSSTDPESDDTSCQTRKQIVSRVKIALSMPTHTYTPRAPTLSFIRFNCFRSLDVINELLTETFRRTFHHGNKNVIRFLNAFVERRLEISFLFVLSPSERLMFILINVHICAKSTNILSNITHGVWFKPCQTFCSNSNFVKK